MKALALAALLLTAIPALAASKQDEAAGAILFRDRGCMYCHGDHLQGTERAPSLDKIRDKLKAPQITTQITHGSKQMPAFGEILTPAEVNQLVLFLRSKNRPAIPAAPVGTAPASPPPASGAPPQ